MLGVPSFPSANSQQRQQSGRNKVALKPGRSLMDWVRFASSPKNDVQGFKGKIRPISSEELRKHNSINDCWMAIKGHVFNVSAYMEYHPGGVDELMKGAGKDASALFDEVHRWVNFQSMLAKCYIGPLKDPILVKKPEKQNKMTSDGFLIPTGPVATKSSAVIPRYDWYESNGEIILSIYTKNKIVSRRNVILDCENGKQLDVKVLFGQQYYQVLLELEKTVCKAKVKYAEGYKIEISLQKEKPSESWKSLGTPSPSNNQLHQDNERDLKFRDCVLKEKHKITHNTSLYSFELPNNVSYQVPIGHHVIVKTQVEGMEISRPYTVVPKSLLTVVPKSLLINQCPEDAYDTLNLMIKTYKDGAVTPRIDAIELNERISISDCTGDFMLSTINDVTNIWMIAAGAGLTPMLRIINYCLYEIQQKRKLSLLFANQQVEDILLKNQLDELAVQYSNKFHVTYILSKPSSEWNSFIGRIDSKILKEFVSTNHFEDENESSLSLPTIQSDSDKNFYLICGPDEFTISMKSILGEHGVDSNEIHCFLA